MERFTKYFDTRYRIQRGMVKFHLYLYIIYMAIAIGLATWWGYTMVNVEANTECWVADSMAEHIETNYRF